MRTNIPLHELETITDQGRAAVLMQPLRVEILKQAQVPTSATEIASRLNMPRQKVNYHLKELHKADFLQLIEERKKRNMIEQRYLATARAYLLTPEVLAPLQVNWREIEDHLSAGFLIALASQTISDVSRASVEADTQGKRLSTLSLVSEMRFENAQQRAQFAQELHKAVVEVIGRYASPEQLADGSPGPGRPYRLILGCYPIPPDQKEEENVP